MSRLGPCPACGAEEGTYHRDGCTAVGIGMRPCCHTPVFLDHGYPHEPTCPQWGERPLHSWVLPTLERDPWRGTTWSAA